MAIILHQTRKGQVFRCDHCDSLHVEFGTVELPFSPEGFRTFWEMIDRLDLDAWEKSFAHSLHRRKIHIAVGNTGATFVLHTHEALELRELLACAAVKLHIRKHAADLHWN